MDTKQLNEQATLASYFLKSLASPIRLKILCQLIDGEKSVGDIASEIDIRDSLASQHLSLLRRDGIVSNRREGQGIYYRLESEAAHQVLEVLFKHFCSTS